MMLNFYMAFTAQSYKIVEGIILCFPVWNDMVDSQIFISTTTAAFVFIAALYLDSYTIPSFATVGYFPPLPHGVFSSKSSIHPILFAHFCLAYLLTNMGQLGRRYTTIGIIRFNAFGKYFGYLFFSFIITNPLQGDGFRLITPFNPKFIKPIPKVAIAYIDVFGDLLDSHLLIIVKTFKQWLNWFTKLFLYFRLATATDTNRFTIATTKQTPSSVALFLLIFPATCVTYVSNFAKMGVFLANQSALIFVSAIGRTKLCALFGAIGINFKRLAANFTNNFNHHITNEKRPTWLSVLLSRQYIPSRALIPDYSGYFCIA